MKNKLFTFLLAAAFSLQGYAWIYPEHRDISLLAILKLDQVHRAQLDSLWALARKGHESRLFISPVDTAQSGKPVFIDYAAWPAIAGDHSTSSADMLNNILEAPWILTVADVAAELKYGISHARNNSDRLNKLRDSDIKLLRADPDYVTRAGSNNVHFMLARPEVNTTPGQYFRECLKAGSEVNAMGTYSWFHISAILKARKFAEDRQSGKQNQELILSALADEAFAIHFLEDMFASGHVAGTWGNAAQRKGTHDYYDEKGLEVSTWEGGKMVLMGDAYMRPGDAETAATTISKSLVQVLDAASGRKEVIRNMGEDVTKGPDTLNISKTNFMPSRKIDTAAGELFREILLPTAVPGLAKGLGQLPRFRAEIGPFIGITAGARGSTLFSGFDTYQNTAGVIAGLQMAFRIGLGMEGVLNEAGDGLIFLDLGWRLDGFSSMQFATDPDLKQFGSITSAIPSRDAYYFRFRMPFYLIPGDLIIAGPILYLFAPKTMTKVLTTSVNGGLIPWQSGIVTSIGRFQFILGREIGVYFYGFPKDPDRFIIPVTLNDSYDQVLLAMRSTQLEFPILEYRPFHRFSTDQTASLVVQIFGGFDIPGKVSVIAPPNAASPKVRTIMLLGLRIGFDWRYYFSKKRT